MENKYHYARVGAFLIVLSVIFAMVVIWLTVGTERVSFVRYQVVTQESVSGLSINASVDYRGVDVGRVVQIELNEADPRFVEILLDIREGTPIQEDTQAVLVSRGVTGLMSVGLTGGSADSELLLPTKMNPIPIIPNGPSLGKRLDSAFTQSIAQFSQLSENLSLFLTPENADSIQRSLRNIEVITSEISTTASVIRQTAEDVSTVVLSMQPNLTELFNSLTQSFDGESGILATFQEEIAQIRQTVAQYEKLALSGTQAMQSIQRFADQNNGRLRESFPRLNAVMNDLQSLMNATNDVLRNVNDHPNMLLFGKPKPRKGPGE